MKTPALVIGYLATVFFISVHTNYEQALAAARASEGSDLAIEQAMYQFGFVVDACDPVAPSFGDKCAAFLSIMF